MNKGNGNAGSQLYRKTLIFGLSVLALFFASAIIGATVGKAIDAQYQSYPTGYIVSSLFTYVASILFSLYLAKKFKLINSSRTI